MPRFRNAKAQAEYAVKQKLGIGKARHRGRQDQKIHSLGTKRNYEQALTRITCWIKENRLGDLGSLSRELTINYLEMRSQCVGQKTLDQDRQALQLYLGTRLPVIKSEQSHALKSRAYTKAQISLIEQAQNSKNGLATKIAHAAGLRAHELLTLQRKEERSASSHRQWSKERFKGLEGKIYTVTGKGGLTREVLIPQSLALELESQRLDVPLIIKDREIIYRQYYNIAGGKSWSNSFSSASKRVLGWSHGAHGLRHTYAQNRMDELQQQGLIYDRALGIISQELGHFRSDITEVYLR